MKLTSGSDPKNEEKIAFMVNDNVACPSFLPMEPADAKTSGNVILANIVNPNIPMTELMRKEFYFDCI